MLRRKFFLWLLVLLTPFGTLADEVGLHGLVPPQSRTMDQFLADVQKHGREEQFIADLRANGAEVDDWAGAFMFAQALRVRPCTSGLTYMRYRADGTADTPWKREGRPSCRKGELIAYWGDKTMFSLSCGNMIVNGAAAKRVAAKVALEKEERCQTVLVPHYAERGDGIGHNGYHGPGFGSSSYTAQNTGVGKHTICN